MRKRFEALGTSIPLRTFQTPEGKNNPRINNNLNARAALQYCDRHMPEEADSWVLYLEDDIEISDDLRRVIPLLVEIARKRKVDCWYLCNRKNPVKRQFRIGDMIVNELDYPILGTHGLLLPKRHLGKMLARHWCKYCDEEIFGAIQHDGVQILQVVDPVLIEHIGEHSTIDPHHIRTLEVNYANPSNIG